ncbi:MAG: response regulator [Desulfuromonadaceae bacterium]
MTDSTPSKSALRLLVAEDNPVNSALVEAMLDKLNYTGTVFITTGNEAVDAYKKQRGDLILMDCHMPEMDGYEATRAIRALEAEAGSDLDHKPVIIIAMTGDAMYDNRDLCLEAGMDGFLAKPFTVHNLDEVLRRWLPSQG